MRKLLGVLVGLVIGCPLVLATNASAESKCYTRWCQETFRLRPHHRAIYKPRAKVRDGDEIHIQVEMKGKLLAHRYLPPCGAEFSAFGVATVADACIRRDHITFILTNTTDHARKVTVRYEFLGRDIVG